jgi:predicted site-specific integrase-resolvase
MGKSERPDVSDCVAHVAHGKLPVRAEQLPTGMVIVHPPKTPTVDSVAIYARVSSADQKADLERQTWTPCRICFSGTLDGCAKP